MAGASEEDAAGAAQTLTRIKVGTSDLPDPFAMTNWLKIADAPFDRDLEVAVIDYDGSHAVAFPCRRILGGWVNAASRARLNIHPTHWREWDTSQIKAISVGRRGH
jgi:hypothetical protein